MKKIYFLYLGLLLSFAQFAKAEFSQPIDLLNAMVNAHKNQNYELYYILQYGDNIKSMKYHHAIENDREFAQLISLDNAYETIVLNNNTVSYLGFTFTPFSLKGSKILDSLPNVFHANFNELSHYDFIPLGKSRIAGRIAYVIKIVPSDHSRFSYTLWIDEENYLLLKSELQDGQNTVLEQFRVIKQRINTQADNFVPLVKTIPLPPVARNISQTNIPLSWQVNWLPTGFKQTASTRQTIVTDNIQETVESQFYSDGLASFTVYLRPQGDEAFNNQFAREEKLILFTHHIDGYEIVVIGDIPMPVAERIGQNVTLTRNGL